VLPSPLTVKSLQVFRYTLTPLGPQSTPDRVNQKQLERLQDQPTTHPAGWSLSSIPADFAAPLIRHRPLSLIHQNGMQS
jgi:hypothetical protein